jgi:DNA replication licensing factor MCM6
VRELLIRTIQDNYLLEIRGDVREGLAPSEEESLESAEASNDKVYYVVREYMYLDFRCRADNIIDPQVDLSDLSSSIPS